MRTKRFIVASVSSNRNSFGLTGMILIARDGEAWQVGANDLNRNAKGTTVAVPVRRRRPDFSHLGFEIPERLPSAPPAVVDEVLGSLALRRKA
jgi:hypothetical protein